MRQIAVFYDESLAKSFSAHLNEKAIDHRIEAVYVRDWGSHHYGSWQLTIWALHEEQLNAALSSLERFRQDPKAATQGSPSPIELVAEGPDLIEGKALSAAERHQEEVGDEEEEGEEQVGAPSRPAPATFWLLMGCVFLFLSSLFSPMTPWQGERPHLPLVPLVTPPVKRALLYDWPLPYQLTDQLLEAYEPSQLLDLKKLPPEGLRLFLEANSARQWMGVYPALLAWGRGQPMPKELQAPRFEKIRQGEVWRAVTPILLHGDLLHLLFNMFWLVLLGRQMEERLRMGRYLLFIGLVAVFSNTAQYLMSGSNFLGFSGVLCGMATFIWQRQRLAPWEGYPLPRETLRFLALFIAGVALVQMAAFVLQLFFPSLGTLPIANTAHLSGAALGFLLGSLSFFKWRLEPSLR